MRDTCVTYSAMFAHGPPCSFSGPCLLPRINNSIRSAFCIANLSEKMYTPFNIPRPLLLQGIIPYLRLHDLIGLLSTNKVARRVLGCEGGPILYPNTEINFHDDVLEIVRPAIGQRDVAAYVYRENALRTVTMPSIHALGYLLHRYSSPYRTFHQQEHKLLVKYSPSSEGRLEAFVVEIPSVIDVWRSMEGHCDAMVTHSIDGMGRPSIPPPDRFMEPLKTWYRNFSSSGLPWFFRELRSISLVAEAYYQSSFFDDFLLLEGTKERAARKSPIVRAFKDVLYDLINNAGYLRHENLQPISIGIVIADKRIRRCARYYPEDYVVLDGVNLGRVPDGSTRGTYREDPVTRIFEEYLDCHFQTNTRPKTSTWVSLNTSNIPEPVAPLSDGAGGQCDCPCMEWSTMVHSLSGPAPHVPGSGADDAIDLDDEE